ncbi:MAG: hypothetical protein FWF78_08630 [Defluviitaleaceae bacterium]|nr:hypothetical protein [Defluviitaleaceae bacterium]
MIGYGKHMRDVRLKGKKEYFHYKPSKFDEKQRLYKMWLPYGRWVCSDGREVLFNRFYEPIWERNANINNNQPFRADPHEWIENIVEAVSYYDDGSPPYRGKKTFNKCLSILKDFGVVGEKVPPI